MHRATDTTEFLAAPVGRYVVGRTWLQWCADLSLCGTVFWGRLDDGDVGQLLISTEFGFSLPTDTELGVLTDASRLEGIDPTTFQRFARFMATRVTDIESRTKRHAWIRPAGFVGAVVAGFSEIVGRPCYPERVFTEVGEALRWLGRSDESALAEEISALVIAASAVPDAVRSLRELLAMNLDPTLAAAARALGASERSLQRQLGRVGTSFRAEVNAARIRRAQTLLADTDQKITSIALEVGYTTPQHFGTLFRQMTGETPSAWRARRQSGVFA